MSPQGSALERAASRSEEIASCISSPSRAMLFNSPAVQNINNAKSEHRLAAAEQRLAEITSKLNKVSAAPTKPAAKSGYDWTKSYADWTVYEDAEELQQSKAQEEAKLAGIMSQTDNLGHYHDHSKERAFFELSEEDKFKACEDNRMMGNYLFSEGIFPKAAEHYQIAIAYYEYCFPDDNSAQANLDELRRACLCNISLCYLNMGYLRQAVEAATTVLKETDGTHGKALFRRAQAYRALDEYELAVADLKRAHDLFPGDEAVIAELSLVKGLWSGYGRSKKDFAQAMLGTAEEENSTRTGGGRRHGHGEEVDAANAETIFNCSMPLEPVVPVLLQELHLHCAKRFPSLAP